MEKCKICERVCKNLLSLTSHISRFHQLSCKHYYDTYMKNDNEGICTCGKETRFCGIGTGYSKHCSSKCSNSDNLVKLKKSETCLLHFGVLSPQKSKEVQEKTKRSMMDLYEVQNISQIQKVKLLKEIKSIEKYGVSNPSKSLEVKLKKKQTCLKNFGVDYYFQTKEFRQKNCERMRKGQASYMLSFVKNPSKPQVELYNLVKSLYEDSVLNFPVKEVNKNIDIAIPSLMIAIEYDGSYWHPLYGNKFKEDQIRQKKLEDLGWKFIRYRDYLPTLEELYNKISTIQ